MKGNKIFDFSRVGFQQIINTMTRKINEVVEVSNGLIARIDDCSTNGVVLKSPNGTLFRIKVDDSGTLTTERVI